MIRVSKYEEPDRFLWTILLFPATRFTIGAYVQQVKDGKWTVRGVKRPFFEVGSIFWMVTVRAWNFGLCRHRIPYRK